MMAKLLEGIATLLIVTGLLVASFQSPGASAPGPSEPPDSDGKVPIKRVCYHEEPKQAFTLREVWRHESPVRVEATIFVDTCELRDLGAGPKDIKNFVKHEKAHARGWMHGDGTPETNAAFDPTIEITGQ